MIPQYCVFIINIIRLFRERATTVLKLVPNPFVLFKENKFKLLFVEHTFSIIQFQRVIKGREVTSLFT